MIITRDNVSEIYELKQSLSQHFEMNELGHLNYFLRNEVLFDSEYYISQAKYVFDIFFCAGLTDCKTVPTLLEMNFRLTSLNSIPLTDATTRNYKINTLYATNLKR